MTVILSPTRKVSPPTFNAGADTTDSLLGTEVAVGKGTCVGVGIGIEVGVGTRNAFAGAGVGLGVAVGLAMAVGMPSTVEAAVLTAAVAVGAVICIAVGGITIVGTDSEIACSYPIPRANTENPRVPAENLS